MSTRPQPLAAITIGFDSYILPLSKATQIVELMAQATPVERDYSASKEIWTMTLAPCRLSLARVHPDQIIAPGEPGKQKRGRNGA